MFREILGETFVCTFIEEDFKIDRSLYIALPINIDYECKYVLSILASRLMTFFFKFSNNEFDTLFPKIRVAEFKKLPIKKRPLEEQTHLIEKVDIMLFNKNEIQKLTQNMSNLLLNKFGLQSFNRKLQVWPSITFNVILKELGRQKDKLSLTEQSEWLQYFEAEKAKVNAIQDLINRTDKEIDAMVYELYGLTEEEVKVVEGG